VDQNAAVNATSRRKLRIALLCAAAIGVLVAIFSDVAAGALQALREERQLAARRGRA
jgi:hypothetical protein